jgi:hypothetical protein
LRSYDSVPRPLLPPSPVRRLSLFLSLPVCRLSSLLTGEEGSGWARSQIIWPRESLALFRSYSLTRTQENWRGVKDRSSLYFKSWHVYVDSVFNYNVHKHKQHGNMVVLPYQQSYFPTLRLPLADTHTEPYTDSLRYIQHFLQYFIPHCFICRLISLWRRLLGLNPVVLWLWHWQSDAQTTRIDIIHCSARSHPLLSHDLIRYSVDLIHYSARSHPLRG